MTFEKIQTKHIKIVAVVIIAFTFAQLYHWFFSEYKLQSPVLIDVRMPWTDKYISPVPSGVRATPIVMPKKAVITPTTTPTPTPKKKAHLIDLVGDVEAAEIAYGYEDKIYLMDEGQKTVMAHIESKMGKAYAELIYRESGFHPESVNSSSGACGLAQALPCEKMACDLTDVDCQLDWIASYVERRYGTIEKTLQFHQAKGWY